MSEFTPDPRSCFVALLDGVEYEMFGALPDHPAQRQTTLHAANLLASGVLFPTLDVHREVAALLIGDPDNGVTIEMMMVAFKENVREALTRYGVKLNGHTRHFLWEYPGGPPRPANVRLSVYAAADRDSAVQQYNAVDSLQAVKGRKHTMQSTLNVAGIEPRSAYLKAASNLAGALDAAVWILHGGAPEYRGLKLLPPPGSVADPLRPELHVLLPHLRAVEVFKPALVGLDEIDLLAGPAPLSPPAFVAGYLSILYRDPARGREFITRLQEEDSGEYSGGLMDAFYAVKKVGDYLFEPNRKARTKPQLRADQSLATVLNCYEDWLSDPAHTYIADDFRKVIATGIIRTFNPALKRVAMAATRQAAKAKKGEASAQAPLPLAGGATAPLADMVLKAVEAHPEGASINDVRDYLDAEYDHAARLNHIGIALARHQRGGRIAQAPDGKWHVIAAARPVTYVPPREAPQPTADPS